MNYINDLGAPVLVAAADIATAVKKPTWNRWVHYGGLAGYILPMFGIVPDKYAGFLTNVGIASLPLAARNLYNQFSTTKLPAFGGNPTVSRIPIISSSGTVGRTYEPQFRTAGMI